MNRYRCYLVDDEELPLSALRRMLNESRRVEVAGFSTDPAVAIEEIQRLEPDVLFLDIHMPEIDGFQMLARLPLQPFVIFTTAYDQHALRAFEANTVDYLLKPIDRERLIRALDKLDARWSNGVWRAAPPVDELVRRVTDVLKPKAWLKRISTNGRRGVFLIDVDRITHFISENRYTYACTENGRYLVNLSLSDLETRLDPNHFLRIHRSAIVHLDFVEHVSSWFAGRLHVRLRDRERTELTVSRERVGMLRQALGLEFLRTTSPSQL